MGDLGGGAAAGISADWRRRGYGRTAQAAIPRPDTSLCQDPAAAPVAVLPGAQAAAGDLQVEGAADDAAFQDHEVADRRIEGWGHRYHHSNGQR
jgi:hypothetical protein